MRRDNQIIEAAKQRISDNEVNPIASIFWFVEGAKYADEHPKEGLVSINKVCQWLEENMCNEIDEFGYDYAAADLVNGNSISLTQFIEMFRKAMEE